MRAGTCRVYDMCMRVLSWSSAHPDQGQGFGVLLTQLQALVSGMALVSTAQRNGLIASRASRSRKQELRREILAVPIAHLTQAPTAG